MARRLRPARRPRHRRLDPGRTRPPRRRDRCDRHPDYRLRRVAPACGLRRLPAPNHRSPRRPLHRQPRRFRGMGRGPQVTAHGVLLPRDAPQDRPADGRRCAGWRPVELRPRQPQARQARPVPARAAALRARRRHRRGARPRRGPLPERLRPTAPVRLRHRRRSRRDRRRPLLRARPAELRRLPGRHAGGAPLPLPRGPLALPQRRPARPARPLPTRRDRVARGPRAAQRRRGLHPPDPRLARVRPRDLRPRRPRLHRAQPPRRDAHAAVVLLDRRDRHGLHGRGDRRDHRRGLRPPHPAADGHRQLRAARRRRPGRGPRLVPRGLRRRLRMGRGSEHHRHEPVRRRRPGRLQALRRLGRLHRPDVRLLPRLPLRPQGPRRRGRLPVQPALLGLPRPQPRRASAPTRGWRRSTAPGTA